jgi:hypothetical protein
MHPFGQNETVMQAILLPSSVDAGVLDRVCSCRSPICPTCINPSGTRAPVSPRVWQSEEHQNESIPIVLQAGVLGHGLAHAL